MPKFLAADRDCFATKRRSILRTLALAVLSVAMILTLSVGHIRIDSSDHGSHDAHEVIATTTNSDLAAPSCEVDPACSAFVLLPVAAPKGFSSFTGQWKVIRSGSLVSLSGPTVSLPPPRFLT